MFVSFFCWLTFGVIFFRCLYINIIKLSLFVFIFTTKAKKKLLEVATGQILSKFKSVLP